MIEVLFGESEGGALKIAQNYAGNGQEIILKYSEVVCIPFLLDIGDINELIESEYRKNLIIDLYTSNGRVDTSIIKQLEEVWSIYLNEIKRLKAYSSQGESIRFWYSNAPYSICGFYYACNLLKEYDCKISAIKLPEHKKFLNDNMMFLSNWGEVEPEKYNKYLSLEKELSESEMKAYSLLWDELKEENSPLRALVNGTVIGVPEDFYDHIIKKEIPDNEFRMAHLIGNILGKYPVGVGDWWYAKRILHMIELGELTILKQQKEIYCQVLKRL